VKNHLIHLQKKPLACAVGLVLAAIAVPAMAGPDMNNMNDNQGKDAGRYVSGDFHNHTTCSDGQLSVQKLVNTAVDVYGLDWFILAGHGGGGNRNCTLVEDETVWTPVENPYVPGMGPGTSWEDSIGVENIKGTVAMSGGSRLMYRWQSIQEIQYPVLERMAEAKQKPIFIGLESVAPGHEHGNMAILDGQLPEGGGGNADAVAKFEYCFDRARSDNSRGEQAWDCSVPGSALNADLHPEAYALRNFDGKNYNSGDLGHLKMLEGLKWMETYFPQTSFYIPAHVERAGPFRSNGNGGWNVENFRNMNNTAPTIAFGMEGGPGHQANRTRSYRPTSVGEGTYGGAGIYTAQIGGVWDALLGEGRNWFIYNNSDYHNRGMFGPEDHRSTNDQYPGEFNETFVLARTGGEALSPQAIVDGLRSGNAYYVNGQLIDRMGFAVCTVEGQKMGQERARGAAGNGGRWPHENQLAQAAMRGEGFQNPNCAQMGEKLVVKPGQDVVAMLIVRDPEGANRSPYSFPNPSLMQIGIEKPLNEPELHRVDLIGGLVTGYIDPSDTERYAGELNSPAATNTSTSVLASYNNESWTSYDGGWKRMFFRLNNVQDSQYLRARGTNIPAGVPNETDSLGNPLNDNLADNIVCADAACPDHLPAVDGGRRLDYDVEAWTDLWFYSNPIFIEVKGSVEVAGIK